MRGYDIYEMAMLFLGYIRGDGSLAQDEGIKKRAIAAINGIITDLGGKQQLISLAQELDFSGDFLEALSYGLAMILSLGEADSSRNAVFTKIYNAKRAHVKASKGTVNEVFLKIGEEH